MFELQQTIVTTCQQVKPIFTLLESYQQSSSRCTPKNNWPV